MVDRGAHAEECPAVCATSAQRIRMPMTGMARQRDAFLHAHAPARWLLAALLWCRHAPWLVANPPPPREAEPAIHATRGVSANAARDAAASAQLEQVRPVGTAPVDGAPPATRRRTRCGSGRCRWLRVRRCRCAARGDGGGSAALRGVIFRITPPAVTLLPAEAEQVPATTPGDPASSTVAARLRRRARVTCWARSTSARRKNRASTTPGWKPCWARPTPSSTKPTSTKRGNPSTTAIAGCRWKHPLEAMVGKDAMTLANALLPQVRPQDLQRMKPWSVLALLEARGESGSDATMDARLQRMASGAGKRLAHLETLEQQLQALDCVPARNIRWCWPSACARRGSCASNRRRRWPSIAAATWTPGWPASTAWKAWASRRRRSSNARGNACWNSATHAGSAAGDPVPGRTVPGRGGCRAPARRRWPARGVAARWLHDRGDAVVIGFRVTARVVSGSAQGSERNGIRHER
jgi:hypothetical protein